MWGWALVVSLGLGAAGVDARIAQADTPLAKALAYDDRFEAQGDPADRLAAGRAYAQAGAGFCGQARDRLSAAAQVGLAGAQDALDRLALRCTTRVTGLGTPQVALRPVPAADGKARAGDFRPLAVQADGAVTLWPGAWQLRLGDGPQARFLTLCAQAGAQVAVAPERPVRLPAEPRARSKVHNAQGQALAATDRCAAAAEFRLAADAALSETYLFNAGVALAGDPPDCQGARAAFDAFLARCNVCRGREDVLARRKALEQACEVSLAVKAPPGATVTIDGVGAPTRMVFPGRHAVVVTQPGMQTARRSVWVAGDTRIQVALAEAPPTPAAPPPEPLAAEPVTTAAPPADHWMRAGLIGGAVALGVGGGLLLAAQAADSDLAALTPGAPGATRQEALDLADRRDGLRLGGWIGVGVGAAAAGFGLWRLVQGPAGGVSVAPQPGGLVFAGGF